MSGARRIATRPSRRVVRRRVARMLGGVLLDARTLRGVQDGTVTLAFRRWTAPRVRVGTRQRTRVGVVEVTSVERVPLDADGAPLVSDDDARRAGMASPGRVLARGAGRGTRG
jgi:hypothetical protein